MDHPISSFKPDGWKALAVKGGLGKQNMWTLNPYHTTFCPNNVVCFLCLLHFRLDFIMEANIMNPDQIAPLRLVFTGLTEAQNLL